MCKFRQLEFTLSDVKNIRIYVNVIDPVRIESPDLLKLGFSLSEVYRANSSTVKETGVAIEYSRHLPCKWYSTQARSDIIHRLPGNMSSFSNLSHNPSSFSEGLFNMFSVLIWNI